MSIWSSKVSITQYNVQGKIDSPIIEFITSGLVNNTIAEIDQQVSDRAVVQ